ncbi:hypothetical protein [Streptomyces sp. NPDC086182]|uniref:hypothetical protein n=1 Tax=Streptomyces sp. NPDC086182 TaxID=3155058 RepID=UPI0034139743
MVEAALDDGPGFVLALAVLAARGCRPLFSFVVLCVGGVVFRAQPRRALGDLPVGTEKLGTGRVELPGHAESDFSVRDTAGEEAVQARRSGVCVVRGRFAPGQGRTSFTGGLVIFHEGERSRCWAPLTAVPGHRHQPEARGS